MYEGISELDGRLLEPKLAVMSLLIDDSGAAAVASVWLETTIEFGVNVDELE